MVVEDAAAADPAHLAAVATALVPVRGRLLLIDSGEPGPAAGSLMDSPYPGLKTLAPHRMSPTPH